MEYLQYTVLELISQLMKLSFKPYYKWNTFNTKKWWSKNYRNFSVLNLIINGIPSIHGSPTTNVLNGLLSFKPYYKWNTFNTLQNI